METKGKPNPKYNSHSAPPPMSPSTKGSIPKPVQKPDSTPPSHSAASRPLTSKSTNDRKYAARSTTPPPRFTRDTVKNEEQEDEARISLVSPPSNSLVCVPTFNRFGILQQKQFDEDSFDDDQHEDQYEDSESDGCGFGLFD